ncbi:MAG: hypothetical protein ACJAV6_000513 [Candidatus Paceibacteria bacterium]|jgi:hypothetical protein
MLGINFKERREYKIMPSVNSTGGASSLIKITLKKLNEYKDREADCAAT